MAKIRIASKNFLCEKCNNLISKGEQYFDWWNVNKDSVYYHKRFHINCLNNIRTNPTQLKSSNFVTEIKDKLNIFDRVQKLLNVEGCLIASNDGVKYYICGIHYDEKGNKSFLCETWEDRKPFYETADNLKKICRL